MHLSLALAGRSMSAVGILQWRFPSLASGREVDRCPAAERHHHSFGELNRDYISARQGRQRYRRALLPSWTSHPEADGLWGMDGQAGTFFDFLGWNVGKFRLGAQKARTICPDVFGLNYLIVIS